LDSENQPDRRLDPLKTFTVSEMVATTQNGSEKLTPPSTIGEWSISQIIAALSRPLPDSMIETRNQGGKSIEYISWHRANKILDKYAPGWNWAIMKIPCSEGLVYREATGTEVLKDEKDVWIGEKPNRRPLKDENDRTVTELKELAYGDPSSNAESMAFRRAAAKFGLGLYLYDR
jgi:Rad52/22 family double-strand break repair protein